MASTPCGPAKHTTASGNSAFTVGFPLLPQRRHSDMSTVCAGMDTSGSCALWAARCPQELVAVVLGGRLPSVVGAIVAIGACSSPAALAVEQQDCSMLDWTSAVNGALLLRPEAP